MVEHKGALIHVDLTGDRNSGSRFHFEGWVAAGEAVQAVWLLGDERRPLLLCPRPDVQRVFPNRQTVGFKGKSKKGDLGTGGGLRFVVELESTATFEIEHPLPPALTERPIGDRTLGALRRGYFRLREKMESDPSRRWRLALRRHLLAQEERSGRFDRRHTDSLLRDFAIAMPEATFIQIGANDGLTGDPLSALLAGVGRRWRGVLVEPVAHLFAQLAERYGKNSALRLERAAIAEQDGSIVIHRLMTSPSDPLWLQELPSLDRDLLRRTAQRFGISEPNIVAETVPSLSVATLLARHHLTRLDLLVIDTEGWDWRVLRQFDLAVLRPKLILYEHQHLSAGENESAHEFLAKDDYQWAKTPEGDTLAWKLF